MKEIIILIKFVIDHHNKSNRIFNTEGTKLFSNLVIVSPRQFDIKLIVFYDIQFCGATFCKTYW